MLNARLVGVRVRDLCSFRHHPFGKGLHKRLDFIPHTAVVGHGLDRPGINRLGSHPRGISLELISFQEPGLCFRHLASTGVTGAKKQDLGFCAHFHLPPKLQAKKIPFGDSGSPAPLQQAIPLRNRNLNILVKNLSLNPYGTHRKLLFEAVRLSFKQPREVTGFKCTTN